MKKYGIPILITVLMSCVVSCEKTTCNIQITDEGTLQKLIGRNIRTVKELTLSGTLNAEDFHIIRNANHLHFLDISNCDLQYLPDSALAHCDSLKEVILPKGLVNTGDFTFSYCNLLEKVILPASVTEIGMKCFSGCQKLNPILLNNNLSIIRPGAFEQCCFTEIELPDKLEVISEETFKECVNLKSIVIPDKVTELRSKAFSGCSNLESVSLPSQVKRIGQECFYLCSSLQNINLKNVDKIEENAFAQCTSLKQVDIKNDLFLSNNSFEGCPAISCYQINDVSTIFKRIENSYLSELQGRYRISTIDGYVENGIIDIAEQRITIRGNAMYQFISGPMFQSANSEMAKYIDIYNFNNVEQDVKTSTYTCLKNASIRLHFIQLINGMPQWEADRNCGSNNILIWIKNGNLNISFLGKNIMASKL